MMKPLALIVDDEPDIRELLEITLSRMDIECVLADSVSQALQLLRSERIALCLTDMNLPDGSGIDLVQTIQKQWSHIPVAVITAYGSMETAVIALKAGAFDFVSKPVELNRLRDLVRNALQLARPEKTAEPENDDPRLLGRSTPMLELKETIRKLARSQAPVYISGESGTGKEVVARLIHDWGPRAGKPFVPVNCGAIPSELMESEFFGHKKGSFTGATEDKQGLFQAAHEGTLFLDEVADLPLPMQVKLLRAIQEKTVRPIGHAKEIPVNVRILSATHKDLAAEVAAGRFRQDLFYRINVIQARIPPLRERGEDIIYLAETFLQRLSDDWGIRQPGLSPTANFAFNSGVFLAFLGLLVLTMRLAMAGPATAATGRFQFLNTLKLTRGSVLRLFVSILAVNLPIFAVQGLAWAWSRVADTPGFAVWLDAVAAALTPAFFIPIAVGMTSHIYLRLRGDPG